MAVISKIESLDGITYDVKDRTLINRTYYPNMQVGGISTSTGANTSSTNTSGKARFRSVGTITYKSGATVTAADGYSYMLLYYNANGDYDSSSGVWATGTNTVPECGYFRILARNSAITDFTGVTNDVITVTDAGTIEQRIQQIYEALESLGWQEG